MATIDTQPGRSAGVRRVADLRLRGTGGTTPVRVRWPHTGDSDVAPPLVVLLPDAAPANGVDRSDDALAVELCTSAGAVVLCTPWAPQRSGALDRAEAALTWAADHGRELGADPARLAVAGRGAGAAGAAALALRARRREWPSIRCQILVLTEAVWLRATGADVVELNGIEAAAASVREALSGRGEER